MNSSNGRMRGSRKLADRREQRYCEQRPDKECPILEQTHSFIGDKRIPFFQSAATLHFHRIHVFEYFVPGTHRVDGQECQVLRPSVCISDSPHTAFATDCL